MKTLNKFQFKKSVTHIAIAIAGLTAFNSVQADEYHYRDILVGDRAAGLGGAFTAIADDASGLYYNPAGIVYAATPKISGSVNAYNIKTTTYKGISKDNPNQEWTRTSAGMVANYFGVVQPLGKATVGFSIAIPNYDLEDQSDSFTNLEAARRLKDTNTLGTALGENKTIGTENEFIALTSGATRKQEVDYNNSDTTTLAGVTLAYPITDNLSLGATLYAHMRKKEMTFKQMSIISNTDGSNFLKDSYYQKVQTDEFGLQPRIGLMWAPVEKVSIGVMVQTTLMVSESPEYRIEQTLCTATQCYEVNNDAEFKEISAVKQDIELKEANKNDLPTEFNIGVAYFASNSLLFSGDFSFATATDTYEATWNAAGGAEYFINPTWAVRGGIYTNNANTNSDVANNGDPHINEVGATLSLSRYTKTSNITIGAGYLGGSGEANLFSSSSNTQDVTTQAFTFYVSTSASF